MKLIHISITILALTIFKVAAEGITLPIFYSIDNDWKIADESPEHNNDRLNDRTLANWYDKVDRKPYKAYLPGPGASPLDTIKWRLPKPQQRAYDGRLQGVRFNGMKRDEQKIAMDGLRRYFGRI